MPEAAQMRKGGKTGAQEDAIEAVQAVEKGIEETMSDDIVRREEVRTPKFRRMRFSWRPEEWAVLQQVYDEVDRAIDAHFGSAIMLVARIQELVRTPMVDKETGEKLTNRHGHTMWVVDEAGYPIEDYSKLTLRQLSDFFMQISTHLFAWEQAEAQLRGEALFAKAQFEEQFAVAYDEPMGKFTVEHRQAKANVDAADERYHAVFRTMVSQKAQAVVKSMERLSLRLKEVYVAQTS